MASVKLQSIQEQNVNAWNGVQVDTAVYIGTGATCPVVRAGRDASIYVMEGTQTAQTFRVVADVVNAYHGAKITVRLGTGATAGTGICSIVNGSFAGVTVATITSGVGREATVVFDGNAMAWK